MKLLQTKAPKVIATAQSLFERLRSEHGVDHAKKMVAMILENAELWQKISKELYVRS